MNKRKLEAMRSMEADCAIGAGAGFGKYTREVAELESRLIVIRWVYRT